MLVELVQDHVGVRVAPEVDDDAHARAVRFVAEVCDAFDGFLAHQVRNLFNETSLVHLVRKLGDDDARLAVGQRLDVRKRPHLDDAASRHVCLADAVRSEDLPCRREIRPLDDRHELLYGRIGIVDEHEHAIDDLAHIVRRDVRRHAHCDA